MQKLEHKCEKCGLDTPPARLDIWYDPDGIWRQIGVQTYGPFQTEAEAEAFALPTDSPADFRRTEKLSGAQDDLS